MAAKHVESCAFFMPMLLKLLFTLNKTNSNLQKDDSRCNIVASANHSQDF